MNLESYINLKYNKISCGNTPDEGYSEQYKLIKNETLKNTLSLLHYNFINLFEKMNERLPTKDEEAHFWADSSRSLIQNIEVVLELQNELKDTEHSFKIDDYYFELFQKCQSFLKRSGGSTLPKNMEKVNLYYTAPLFISENTQQISRGNKKFYSQLNIIGEGSYAKVFKFRDEFYDKDFVLKRAKSNLAPKELERFKSEFSEMKKLSSPYVVEVYNFIESKNEYIMEYMDFTLDEYIKNNNKNLKDQERYRISLQILSAFKYIHSKEIYHRDISPKNILLKKYEDTIVVKISDFGLVKTRKSNLTSVNTNFKGYFNDPTLEAEGFGSYNIQHEVYALTRVIYYAMTGKTNILDTSNPKLYQFIKQGINVEKEKRFKSVEEMYSEFKKCF